MNRTRSASVRRRAASMIAALAAVSCGTGTLDGLAIGRTDRDLRLEVRADTTGSGRALFRSNSGIESIVSWDDTKAEAVRLHQTGFQVAELQIYGPTGAPARSSALAALMRQLQPGQVGLSSLVDPEPPAKALGRLLRTTEPGRIRMGLPLALLISAASIWVLFNKDNIFPKDDHTVTRYPPGSVRSTSIVAGPLPSVTDEPSASAFPTDTPTPTNTPTVTPTPSPTQIPHFQRIPPPRGDASDLCVAATRPIPNAEAIAQRFPAFRAYVGSLTGGDMFVVTEPILLPFQSGSALANEQNTQFVALWPFWPSQPETMRDYDPREFAGAMFPNGHIMYGATFRVWWANAAPGYTYGMPTESFDTVANTNLGQATCTLATPSVATRISGSDDPGLDTIPWANNGNLAAPRVVPCRSQPEGCEGFAR